MSGDDAAMSGGAVASRAPTDEDRGRMRLHLQITGRVQGVFYRGAMQDEARVRDVVERQEPEGDALVGFEIRH